MPRFLWQFYKDQKKYVLTFGMVATVTAIIITLRSYWYSYFIDEITRILQSKDLNLFFVLLGVLVLTEFVLFVLRVFQWNISVQYRWYMNINARVRWVRNAICMNYQKIAKLWSGKLLQIIHSGMESYSYIFYEWLFRIIEVLVSLISIVFVLSIESYWFLLFIGFSFVSVYFFQKLTFQKLAQTRQKDVELNEIYTKQTTKILMNFILLKIYNIEEQELKQLEKVGFDRVNNFTKMKLRFNGIASSTNFMIIILMVLSVWYFGYLYVNGLWDLKTVIFIFMLMAFTRQQFYSLWIFVAELG